MSTPLSTATVTGCRSPSSSPQTSTCRLLRRGAEERAGHAAERLAQRHERLGPAAGGPERQVDRRHRQRPRERGEDHLARSRSRSAPGPRGSGRRGAASTPLFLWRASRRSFGGSSAKTSSAAPPMWPDSSASSSASSSITPPRPQLTISAPFFILRQALAVQHVAGLLGERRVERDHVRAGEQIVDRQQLDVQLAGRRGVEEGVVGHDLHLEAAGAVRHPLADAAEADDPDRLALKLDAGDLAVPLPRPHRGVGLGHPAGEREEQREGVLGGRHQVGRGRVDDQDAELGRGGHVDVVDADAGAPHHLELLAGAEQLGGGLGGAAHDQGVEVGEDLGQARALLRRELIDLRPGLLEQLEAGGVEGVRDQDSGHGYPYRCRRSGDLLQDLIDHGQQDVEVALAHLAHVADAEGGRLPVAVAAADGVALRGAPLDDRLRIDARRRLKQLTVSERAFSAEE